MVAESRTKVELQLGKLQLENHEKVLARNMQIAIKEAKEAGLFRKVGVHGKGLRVLEMKLRITES